MPVREAISRLTALGALTVVSGRSIGVPKLGPEELADLRRVRLQVEATAVRWATENIDDEFIGRLQGLLDAMEEAENLGRVKEFIHSNYDFHFTIYSQARSPVLLEIISNMWLRVNPHFHLLHRYGHYRVSNRQHRALVEAICARDAEAAVRSLHEDINSAYEVIRASLERQKATG